MIYPTSPRQEAQITFPDDQVFQGPIGATIEQFVQAAYPAGHNIVAALINNQLRELNTPLHRDAQVIPITSADSDGTRIFRRSLSFLMIAAAAECFPGRNIVVLHSLPFGGYYCEWDDRQPVTSDELNNLRQRMNELVEAALPIEQVKLPLEEALRLFSAGNDLDKADLFTRRRKDYLTVYELNGVRDYFHGFMVPNTSYLTPFDLKPYADGFILHFPRRHEPDRLQPFEDEPRLAQVFRDYHHWLNRIGVPEVAALNRAINNNRIQEVILVAEAFHQQQLGNIATEIAGRWPKVRIVFISGPTSAGKTTFAKKLAVQLLAQGIHPVAINMDNYFVNRENTPRDENGDYDFETIDALDVPLFLLQLQQLLRGETIIQPIFDFRAGQRKWGNPLTVGRDRIMVIEGIHALNPRLAQGLPPEAIYRVFISAFTQLNLDRHNRVPTTDTRLLRRIVRDAAHRGYTAAQTISRWPSVRRGEKKHIFPYQNNADLFFNSALVYELSLLKQFAQPLLLQVEPGTVERIEANRLLAFLQWFDPLPAGAMVPGDSILREFIGDSIMEHFEPWR